MKEECLPDLYDETIPIIIHKLNCLYHVVKSASDTDDFNSCWWGMEEIIKDMVAQLKPYEHNSNWIKDITHD